MAGMEGWGIKAMGRSGFLGSTNGLEGRVGVMEVMLI